MADLTVTDEEREVLAEMLASYRANRPQPMPLHQVRTRVRSLYGRRGTFQQMQVKPLAERLAKLEARAEKVRGFKTPTAMEKVFHPLAIGMAHSDVSNVASQLSEAERRVAAAQAELDAVAADELRFDEEWKRCQPQHDKARGELLRRLVDDATAAVKAAQKAGQKADTVDGFRQAADRLQAAQGELERAQARLGELGRPGVRDWR